MINSFTNDYRFLSNFYSTRVEFEGLTYPSVEHAYQAAKTEDKELRKQFARGIHAGEAKKLGNKITLRRGWENIKLSIMEELVRKKFQDIELKDKLLATGEQELIEGNTWGDVFWGQVEGQGKNHLGKILMRVRAELKEKLNGFEHVPCDRW